LNSTDLQNLHDLTQAKWLQHGGWDSASCNCQGVFDQDRRRDPLPHRIAAGLKENRFGISVVINALRFFAQRTTDE
jgi:hypothetical protein